MWDEIVDVVSVGAGPGGLACAIAAVDAGLDVFVARPAAPAEPAPEVDGARGWLPPVTDEETMAYFRALSDELPTVTLPADPAELPIRTLCEVKVDTSRRAQVETFVGARLGIWAAGCIASPYGLLFTRVAGWPTTTMRTTGGKSFEVLALDESDGTHLGRTFSDRMSALAAARDIEVLEEHPLQRIVFEEGEIVGVVVDSKDGPWAVRARVGIAVTSSEPAPDDASILGADSRIALIGLTASRFGRVEVLRTVDAP
jgi:FAD binding domain